MNWDVLEKRISNDIKKILSGSYGKVICVISVDHFAGLVIKLSQDDLTLINEVTIQGGAECLPDYRLMYDDRAYKKLKRYVESDRQMDSTIMLDDKAYSCREVEAMYSDAKENVSKLIGGLQKILADAGYGEDETVYVIGGYRALAYFIMYYCREKLSADALLPDHRIHVDPSNILYDSAKEAMLECGSGKKVESTESESREASGGQTEAGKGESGESENKEPEKKIEAAASGTENGNSDVQKKAGIAGSGEESGLFDRYSGFDDMAILTDLPHRLIPKEYNEESGQWHKVKLPKEYFDKPLKVRVYRKTYQLDLPSSITDMAFIDFVMEDKDTFTIEVKFWGETCAENHLYLRGDSSYMGSDNKIYHYDFSHPPKKL